MMTAYRTNTPRRAAALCAAIAWCAGVAHAQTVVLLDRDLHARAVEIKRIADGSIAFTSAATGMAEQVLPLDGVLAIVEPSWWSDDSASMRNSMADPPLSTGVGMLECTDGRRIPGRLDLPAEQPSDNAGDPPPDVIRWEHSGLLGVLEFKLEDVARVRLVNVLLPGSGPVGRDSTQSPARLSNALPEGPERDRVLLTNGDMLSGLVERIGMDVWVSDRGSVTRTPQARVHEITLVNPPAEARGTMVWLQGGSVIRVEHVGIDPGRGIILGIDPSAGKSRQVTLTREDVRAIVPDAQRLRALSSLAVAAEEVRPGRLAPLEPAMPVPGSVGLLGVGDIELGGPMSVEWTLPQDSAHLAGWLVLPASCAHWGDCVVVIEAVTSAGKAIEMAREPINANRAAIEVNAVIPSGSRRLRITIDEGPRGPIQDRVLLHRFMIAR